LLVTIFFWSSRTINKGKKTENEKEEERHQQDLAKRGTRKGYLFGLSASGNKKIKHWTFNQSWWSSYFSSIVGAFVDRKEWTTQFTGNCVAVKDNSFGKLTIVRGNSKGSSRFFGSQASIGTHTWQRSCLENHFEQLTYLFIIKSWPY